MQPHTSLRAMHPSVRRNTINSNEEQVEAASAIYRIFLHPGKKFCLVQILGVLYMTVAPEVFYEIMTSKL